MFLNYVKKIQEHKRGKVIRAREIFLEVKPHYFDKTSQLFHWLFCYGICHLVFYIVISLEMYLNLNFTLYTIYCKITYSSRHLSGIIYAC